MNEAAQRNEPECLSDEALARSTGYTWNEWFAILDAQGVADRSRAEIAQFLREAHGLSLWWANTVNVGYERARTARVNDKPSESFEISVSRTFSRPSDRLFAAFVEPSGSEGWPGRAELRLVSSRPNRWAHFDWQDGSSRVSAYFTDKGVKSTVKVRHAKLRSADDAEAMKRYWRKWLTDLQRVLDREASEDR